MRSLKSPGDAKFPLQTKEQNQPYKQTNKQTKEQKTKQNKIEEPEMVT